MRHFRFLVAAFTTVACIAGIAAAAPKKSAGHPVPYTYHGCPLYAPNDWFTTNLITGGSKYVPNAVDPTSANIVANLSQAYPRGDFGANVDASLAGVNIVNSRNLKFTPLVTGLKYGFADDAQNDDRSPHRIKIPAGRFMQEGTAGCARGDCHVNVLDTDTCIEYETYNWGAPSWNGATYVAEGGGVKNLRRPYNEQLKGIPVTAASIPNMGTTDWGEEAHLRSIPHILAVLLPIAGVANGGYVLPAGYGPKCASYCRHPLPFGARLRLHASYPCPPAVTYSQANLLCRQMKTYGIIFNDATGIPSGFGVRLGLASDGSNPWHSSDYNALLKRVKIGDFDVMALGTVY
jgi:hypothetical protein